MHGITYTRRNLIQQQEALALELKVLMMWQEKRSWELPSKMTGHLEMPLDGAAPKYVAGLIQQGRTRMQNAKQAQWQRRIIMLRWKRGHDGANCITSLTETASNWCVI
jgi:hypothetical protein